MRCFVAIELPDEVKAELDRLQGRLRERIEGVRWTPAEQVHLTVQFLGEVADREVAGVCRAVAAAAAGVGVFGLAVRGAGCFPTHGPPRVIWAGLEGMLVELSACQRVVASALQPLGFAPEDRPFHPHLTLGRVRDARGTGGIRDVLAAESSFTAGEFEVAELIVFESILARAGAQHTPITRAALSGA